MQWKACVWLVHVDDWAFKGAHENLHGRDPRVIDVAHVRWATTTAVTAVDLSVAEIAARYCGEPFWSERMPSVATVRARLTTESPPAASAWLRQGLRRGFPRRSSRPSAGSAKSALKNSPIWWAGRNSVTKRAPPPSTSNVCGFPIGTATVSPASNCEPSEGPRNSISDAQGCLRRNTAPQPETTPGTMHPPRRATAARRAGAPSAREALLPVFHGGPRSCPRGPAGSSRVAGRVR